MKQFRAFILLLVFLTNIKLTFAEESYYPGIKTAVGTAAIVGSIVLWRHLDKKIKHLERTQIFLEQMKRFENSANLDKRIKKLTRYKYFSLFAALLSLGYTINKAIKFAKSFEPVEDELEPEKESRKPAKAERKLNKKSYEQWGDSRATRFTCRNGLDVIFFYERNDQNFSYGMKNISHKIVEKYDNLTRRNEKVVYQKNKIANQRKLELDNENQSKKMISAWLEAWKQIASQQCKLSQKHTWEAFEQNFNNYRDEM
ncbi:hypothetical protein KAT92_04535 [Candidatus Babeliales bacterium]|nr:hypothetical protein [Candidatus Babeliales bacterium]